MSTILKTALAVQLISGKPQGKPTPHDVTSYSALFGGLTNSNELQITVAAGDVLALKVTQADIATQKGHAGGLGANMTFADGGIDMCLSTTPGVFDGNVHRTATNVTTAQLTGIPPNASAGLDKQDFYINLKRHDGKAGFLHIQNHGPGADATK